MNKFQNVNFRSINDFLNFLPEDELLLVETLRDITYECMLYSSETLSYNVPYFSLNKKISFIWPSSVPWGKVRKNGVLYGFVQGYKISDEINWLEKGERKKVYVKTFFDVDKIDVDILKSYIYQAIMIDNESSL